MQDLNDIGFTIALYGAICFIVYTLAKYGYRAKKLSAEKGSDPMARKLRKGSLLVLGCVAIGLSVGLGICAIYTTLDLAEDTYYFLVYATALGCGGLGLVVAHLVTRNIDGR